MRSRMNIIISIDIELSKLSRVDSET